MHSITPPRRKYPSTNCVGNLRSYRTESRSNSHLMLRILGNYPSSAEKSLPMQQSLASCCLNLSTVFTSKVNKCKIERKIWIPDTIYSQTYLSPVGCMTLRVSPLQELRKLKSTLLANLSSQFG